MAAIFGEIQRSMNYCLTRYLSGTKEGDKPKKPATHFVLYYKTIQNTLDAKSPGGNVTEKVKIASQMYKELSTAEKEALNEKSTQLLEEYKKKVALWESSLPDEERDMRIENMRMKREIKEKRKLKKLQRENEKPKKNNTAFLLYRSDQLKDMNLDAIAPQKKLEFFRKSMSDHAKQWNALSEGDKESYMKMAAEEKKVYESELQQWELNMIEQGKENLIRKQSRVKHQRAMAKIEGTKRTRSKTVSKKSGVKSKTAVKKKVRFVDGNKEKSSHPEKTKKEE